MQFATVGKKTIIWILHTEYLFSNCQATQLDKKTPHSHRYWQFINIFTKASSWSLFKQLSKVPYTHTCMFSSHMLHAYHSTLHLPTLTIPVEDFRLLWWYTVKGALHRCRFHAGFVEIFNASILKLRNYRITPTDTYTSGTTVNEIKETDKYRPLNNWSVSGKGDAAE
jgi:hypothetical protein